MLYLFLIFLFIATLVEKGNAGICRMLTMSLFIDKYGWSGATKRNIGIIQYAGLLCVVGGIILLK